MADSDVTGVLEKVLVGPERDSAQASSPSSATAIAAPKRIGPGRSIGCVFSSASVSSCGVLRSMTTKRKSTMMAPA